MSYGKTVEEARHELRERMEFEGAVVAYETALAICRDPKASATAKASAINSLLRVAGYDGKPGPDFDKPLDEMTYEETNALLDRLRRREAALNEPDVFG
ncbi:hypothetical protein [Methylobacterium sp. Leaf466]|uniref:hypothetical protein n=1 Tax=Methylobacterium sp. Leaf466 TaxID=1736386 RepID=UPI0006FAAC6D|nr:hypothetical protein [Methylobacterium sp. Leaf466]KQT80157.1 hypothetical protein ASG59_19460 [Methylobacterium sp. Leaf466]